MGGWVNEESFSDYTVLYGQGSNLFTQRHQNTRFLTVSILWFIQMTNLELCKRMFLIFSSPLERKNFGAKKSEPTLRTFSAKNCPSLFTPSSPQPARRCLCFCSSGESKKLFLKFKSESSFGRKFNSCLRRSVCANDFPPSEFTVQCDLTW